MPHLLHAGRTLENDFDHKHLAHHQTEATRKLTFAKSTPPKNEKSGIELG